MDPKQNKNMLFPSPLTRSHRAVTQPHAQAPPGCALARQAGRSAVIAVLAEGGGRQCVVESRKKEPGERRRDVIVLMMLRGRGRLKSAREAMGEKMAVGRWP